MLVATLDDQEVTVLDARNKFDTLVAEVLLEILDEQVALLGRQVAAMMIFDLAVLYADEIASHGHVVRLHVVADAGGFEGAAAFVDLMLVISEYD